MPMSRGPNWDLLPLHKPEAYSKHCNGLLLRVDAAYFQMFTRAPLTIHGNGIRWSLTYVATPIAVAVREALFTSSGLTNSTRRGVQSSLQCNVQQLRFDSSFLDSLCAVLVLCFSSLGSVAGRALVSFVSFWFLVIRDLNLVFRVTVSPAKRASPQFMKMVRFCSSHLL